MVRGEVRGGPGLSLGCLAGRVVGVECCCLWGRGCSWWRGAGGTNPGVDRPVSMGAASSPLSSPGLR